MPRTFAASGSDEPRPLLLACASNDLAGTTSTTSKPHHSSLDNNQVLYVWVFIYNCSNYVLICVVFYNSEVDPSVLERSFSDVDPPRQLAGTVVDLVLALRACPAVSIAAGKQREGKKGGER